MARLELFCRIATPFTPRGALDEDALRIFLQRFIKHGIGIYLASAGGGESHALTWQELERIYKIGMEECGGKIPVYANPPEQYTVSATREYMAQAIAAGVDLVSIYGLASRHGMKPTDAELALYFREVLAAVRYPVSLAVNQPIMGYQPKPAVMAEACNRHRQIVAVNLSHTSDRYFVQFMDRLERDIPVYVHLDGSLNKIAMGARGIFGTEANIIPRTQRRYIDACESRNFAQIGRYYRELIRYNDFCGQWYPSVARAIKMAMRLLKLPGWEGGLREPYRMPGAKEYRRFADGFLCLGIAEIAEQARAAGVRVPRARG